MSTRNAALIIAALAIAAVAYALYLYPVLPAQIPVHWDINGHADGLAAKTAAFAMPAISMTLLMLMLWALPWLSPRTFSLEPFRGTFNYVTAVLAGMFFCIHVISLQAALHSQMDMGKPLISVLFLFFALIGNVIGKTRRNFWMGWRTPWTLASDTVWVATHRLAARLMFWVGILGAFAVWLGVPPAACFVLFIVAMIVPSIYSLVLYKRLEREGQAPDAAPPA